MSDEIVVIVQESSEEISVTSVVESSSAESVTNYTGTPGKSAYVLAVENGFVGDYDAWYASLLGPVGPRGATGIQGPTGTQGPTGPMGPRGLTGNTGSTGAQGPQGVQGATGATGPIGATGPQGDSGYTAAVDNGFVGDETTWLASLVGPQGPQGTQGDAGLTGAEGPEGSQGIQGIQGIQGDQGITGDQGIQGIQGETGLKGDTGDQGIQGIQGIQGVQGIQGIDGQTVLNGTVVPTTEGIDGDFYINTSTDEIYGPKTAGAWGSGTSLVGPTGPSGSGTGDVIGPASAVNNNFAAFDTSTGKLIKDSGVTTSSFATSAQGALADTAMQPSDNVSTLINDAAYINAAGAPVQTVDGLSGAVSLSGNYDAIGSAAAAQAFAIQRANHTGTQATSTIVGLDTALSNKLETSLKGAVNGLAELDAGGRVPAAQLPSYVDDVLEFSNLAAFPVTGETAKLYVALDSNFLYRWTGTVYLSITSGGGVADSANTLATPRTISLGGDATGSVSFDGSADVTITAVIVDDSHNHIIGNVDGLQIALDGKSATGHTHTGVYEPADATIIKAADIGVTVQGYDATTVKSASLAAVATSGAYADLTGSPTLGTLAGLSTVNAATITDNSVGAAELNVAGNGTATQYLRSDGDGSFTWADVVAASSIATLTDVDLTGLANGDVMTYNSTSSNWEVGPPTGGNAGAEVFVQATEPVSWVTGDVWIPVP